MQADRPSPTEDEIAVRLQWPGDPLATDRPGPAESAAPSDSGVSSAPLPVEVAEIVTVPDDAARSGRGLIEAYDRLGGRILERLRALRDDVDSDLAEVRSELASLRQAVDDVGDRVQLRQMRATVDELRGDVSGLRRAVLEWPELEQVSSDVAGLRADVSNLLSRPVEAAQGSRDLARLRADVATLLSRPEPLSPAAEEPAGLAVVRAELAEMRRLLEVSAGLPTLAPLIEEVSGLRDEVASLRRRISLRASGSTVELSEEQLQRLIVALEARLGVSDGAGGRVRAR